MLSILNTLFPPVAEAPNPRNTGGFAFDPDPDPDRDILITLALDWLVIHPVVVCMFKFAPKCAGAGDAEDDEEEDDDELSLPCPSPLPVAPFFA